MTPSANDHEHTPPTEAELDEREEYMRGVAANLPQVDWPRHALNAYAEVRRLRADSEQWRAEVKRLMDSAVPEKAWLIEAAGDRPMWWNGDGATSNDFTEDHNRAIRFATKESASLVIYHLLSAYSFALRPTSHLWFDESAISTARQEPTNPADPDETILRGGTDD